MEKFENDSSSFADVIQFKMIKNENLFDSQYNNEDIEDTLDLENSINELGFTDPLEVTDFYDIGEGNYTIVSGHRRRSAGVKQNISKFPCIIRSFKNEEELKNYILLSNSHRDSSKDPLLFCKRYRVHEAYLEESNFKGSKREEIAKRFGISAKQVDRYNQFNHVISPVWDMVRDGTVGMSSVVGMAAFGKIEQNAILNILLDCIKHGDKLTRENCEKIIKGYKSGKKTYEDILKMDEIMKSGGKKSVVIFKNKDDDETKISPANPDGKNKPLKAEAVINKPIQDSIIIEIDKFAWLLKAELLFSSENWALSAIDRMCKTIEALLIQIERVSKKYKMEEKIKDRLIEIKNNLEILMKD